jgi:hypothetical protein
MTFSKDLVGRMKYIYLDRCFDALKRVLQGQANLTDQRSSTPTRKFSQVDLDQHFEGYRC